MLVNALEIGDRHVRQVRHVPAPDRSKRLLILFSTHAWPQMPRILGIDADGQIRGNNLAVGENRGTGSNKGGEGK